MLYLEPCKALSVLGSPNSTSRLYTPTPRVRPRLHNASSSHLKDSSSWGSAGLGCIPQVGIVLFLCVTAGFAIRIYETRKDHSLREERMRGIKRRRMENRYATGFPVERFTVCRGPALPSL